jgi:hypothetical protein
LQATKNSEPEIRSASTKNEFRCILMRVLLLLNIIRYVHLLCHKNICAHAGLL